MSDAETIIRVLRLQPHPEGCHYAETWRAEAPPGERPPGTAIYYFLQRGERDAWHRVDAAEVWHFYAGDPLVLSIAAASGDEPPVRHILGPDIEAGQRPQIVVPAGEWQSAESLGEWTLVGCTVSPGFVWDGFELAEPGWEPGHEPQ
jgi:hypothetical protein